MLTHISCILMFLKGGFVFCGVVVSFSVCELRMKGL